MALVTDQRLTQTAASVNDIHKIVHDPVFQSQHHVQIPKADVCIHNDHLFAQHGKTSADVGCCGGLPHAAFSGCNDDDFTHDICSS